MSALMTELEAVNVILQAADEAPVGSLALSGLFPLDKAKGILTETSRVVQSMGWKFNTEDAFPVSRAVDGTVTLPATLLSFDVSDEYLHSIDPVQRGQRLYDSRNHTYSFTQDLKGTAVFFLSWEELPQAARHYITIRAARTMQGRSSISDSTYRYSADDEQVALAALGETESTTGDHNMLRDSMSVASVLLNH